MQKKRISIAIPASVVSDVPHLREKTSKAGLIGRAAAIFRVNEIIVYPDNPRVNQSNNMNLIATLLAYMDTPQYLRKRLFKLKPELRYAGILPPLRTPHHPLNRKMKNLKVGEHREGVVLSKKKTGVLVDIGVEKPAFIPKVKVPIGRRVTVRITKIDEHVEAELSRRDKTSEYWGYTVTTERFSFGKIVKTGDFDLTVAASKHGVPLVNVEEKMAERWKKASTILVAFGAPTQGLHEITEQESLNLEEIVDFVINTVPMQGTETVRTEEALIASLAILNMHFPFKV